MDGISIIIPAYNEAKGIGGVVASVKEYMAGEKLLNEIIVVDDCSSDGTADAARAFGVTVIRHPVNRGYGAALTSGLKRAQYEHILIMDADGSYPVHDLAKLLPFADDFDMVVGARQGKHYHGSLMKRVSRAIFYYLLMYVTGEKVPDANSGMRIFKKSVVMQFEDDFCMGFSFTTTLTIILLSNRYLIKFVPIEYRSRTGRSKVRHLRDTARTVQILLQNISYYNPIKAFLPFSILSLFVTVCFGCCSVCADRPGLYGLGAVIMFFSFMLFLGFGMMGYIIVKGNKAKA